MEAGDTISELVATYVPQLPLQCVWIVGIVLALVGWRKHPNVSLLTVLAFGAYIVLNLIYPLAWRYVFSALLNRADGEAQRRILVASFGFVWCCLLAIPSLLVLAAIFGWRRPPAASPVTPVAPTWRDH